MINRKQEVRELIRLTSRQVMERAGDHLVVCETLEDLHLHFANSIATEIRNNNDKNVPTRLILPIGPTGQYPILAQIITNEHLSLKYTWIFFMDEYCDEDGKALMVDHPLSFKRIAKEKLLNLLREEHSQIDKRILFPKESNLDKLAEKIDKIGGIDVCYGGIGIHGHLAFNEPAPEITKTDFRKVKLNDFTVTINSIRAEIGGDLENFPREAFTIGMKQILGSRKIRLYCRNGAAFDWANTVLRIALFGEPGDDYPVTHIRNHPDYQIITDKDTLATPKNLL
jgi:glucosamine-6-phosphate deaminase